MKLREYRLTTHPFDAAFVVISIVLFLAVIGNVHAHKSKTGSKQSTGLINILAASALNNNNAGGQTISNLIDGNLNTIWKTNQLRQRIELDLGLSQMINRVRIAFGNHMRRKAHQYSISISLDGANWVKVANNRRIGTSRWAKASFPPVNARYVRINLNSVGHTDILAIRDIEIYGRNGNSNNNGNQGNQRITLNWLPSLGHIQGYLVFYGPTARMASAQVSDITINTPGFNFLAPSIQYDTWLDLNALPGDNVCFRVRSYGAAGLSEWSSAVCSGV